MIEDNDDLMFYKSLFNISRKNVKLIKVREYASLDALQILLNYRIKNFDNNIIENLRLLRSFRNLSEFAHEISPTFKQKKFKKLGFTFPLVEDEINHFWGVFLNNFLQVILLLKTVIQTYISKKSNDEILLFESFFNLQTIKLAESINLIFKFENKHDSRINIYAYKVDFLFEDKFLIPGGWNILKIELNPNEKKDKPWNPVNPEYYGIKENGEWKVISYIQYKVEGEFIYRIHKDISKLIVNA